MFRQILFCGCATFLACAALPGIANAAVDLSTPKSAAKSFSEATLNSDAAAMRDCLDGGNDPQAQEIAGAYIDVILAAGKLADAAKARFGAGNEPAAPAGVSIAPETADAIDKAAEEDHGDLANLKIDPNAPPRTFHKTAAGWKMRVIDPAANRDALPEQLKLLQSLASAMTDTTDDITAGKFPASADAEAAIQQRFSEAIDGHYKPTTMPADKK